ncbi:thiamine-monophosphate kinase, partial [Candidatus Heimdallarchaeota archaeon]
NMTFFQMGAKSTTMAISDLAAKGVHCQLTIASGVFPGDYSGQETVDIVKGIQQISHECGAKFLGGDTNEGNDLVLSVVAAGVQQQQKLIKRQTANIGDYIYTSGPFGLTGAGFKIFLENVSSSKQQRELFYKAVYEPKPKCHLSSFLTDHGLITSCIDSSDGLAWSLYELIRDRSNLGIILTELPVHPLVIEFAEDNNLNPLDLVFYGGEEFELVFTVGEKEAETFKKRIAKSKINVNLIGKITSENPGEVFFEDEGTTTLIKQKGWEHFKK